jgi:hypothetical protein
MVVATLPALTAAGRGVPHPGDVPALLHAGISDVVLLLLLIGAVLTAAGLAYRAWQEAQGGPAGDEDDIPPIVFPYMGSVKRTPRPAAEFSARASDGAAVELPGSGAQAGRVQPTGSHAAAQPTAAAAPSIVPVRSRAASPATSVPADDLADVTLQLLPGRLEVVSGDAGVEEIRFVRTPGSEPVVTLGRGAGSPPGHVQLRSPTVSRRHARLRFDGGAWHISNLSGTNPAVVNGAELGPDTTEFRLEDGDQLELGDVVLRFRC